MVIPDKALNDLRDAVSLPASPMEKIGFLMVGLLAGTILPRFMVRFLLYFAGHSSAMGMTLILLIPYLLCVGVVWWFWHRRRYFAIGFFIPVIVQILIFTSAFVLWWVTRLGQ